MPQQLRKYQQLFGYIGIAAVALLVIGLAGWFFFLRERTSSIEDLDAARGFDIAVPSFTGPRSSTSENIAGGVTGESLLFRPQPNARPPRLWRISQSPVAGAGFVVGTSTIRYVERSTGYVYDANPVRGSIVRRTNTLLPKVYDADVLSDGGVVLHMLSETNERATILGRVSATTTDEGLAELEVVELDGIRAVAPSPVLPDMLLVAMREDGEAQLIRASSEGGEPESLAQLPVTSLEPLWLADGRMFVSERPASGVLGGMYQVASSTFTPLVRATPGLVALPHASSSALLYSSDDGSQLRLFTRASADASTLELSLQTTAAKCVWGQDAASSSAPLAYCAAPQTTPPQRFTDSWLRGIVHTQDTWYAIDVGTAKTERFFVPETTVALDVEHPTLDLTGRFILFTNARDKSLWVLRIEE